MDQIYKINSFERMGLGLFVHFGVFSVIGKGEWYKAASKETDEKYDEHAKLFNPKHDWADAIVAFAKKNGFKYIVLTTRHHDGFSLYDTFGLSDFDSVHLPMHRDLVREFIDSCNRADIVPFFYHTLIDWREEKKYISFHDYLCYLRSSVEILCKQYGKIGGFWFDGQWKYPKADWELDSLYGMIRKYQPDAMIINNSGLNRLGEKTHSEIDAVTYERANMVSFDREKAKGLYSVEMCQSLNGHWGFAESDISYKSVSEVVESLCLCRAKGGNFLLNIGPLGDGSIREIEKAIIDLLGQWVGVNSEAIYEPKPIYEDLEKGVFVLGRAGLAYIFFLNTPMEIDSNAGRFEENKAKINLGFVGNVCSAEWLDNGEEIEIIEENGALFIQAKAFDYGSSLTVRIAKCILK